MLNHLNFYCYVIQSDDGSEKVRKEPEMATRLYVGNLPYSVTKAKLEEMFSPFGTISDCTVVSDKYSGRSKGFGFVEFEDDAAAKQAIEKLNGSDLEGRNIVVNEARPREERQSSGQGAF